MSVSVYVSPPQTGPPSFGNPFVKCLEVPVQVCIRVGKHRTRKGEQFVCGVRRRRCWIVVSQWIRGVYSVYKYFLGNPKTSSGTIVMGCNNITGGPTLARSRRELSIGTNFIKNGSLYQKLWNEMQFNSFVF